MRRSAAKPEIHTGDGFVVPVSIRERRGIGAQPVAISVWSRHNPDTQAA
jgi:hypothetical protein